MESSWRKNYLRYKSFFLNTVTQYRERSDWKAYLEILLSLFTISIFSVFALRPTILTIAELIKQISEKKQTISLMDTKIQNLSKAQILSDQQRNNIAILKEIAIPVNASPEIVSRQIEGLSVKNQASLYALTLGKSQITGSISPQVLSTPESSQTLPQGANGLVFSVNFRVPIDQYLSLTKLMEDFNNLRRPAKLSRIEMGIENNKDNADKRLYLLLEGKLPYLTD